MVDLPTFAINLWYMVGTYASPMDGPAWGKKASCKANAMDPSSTQISHPYEVKQIHQKIPQFLVLRFFLIHHKNKL